MLALGLASAGLGAWAASKPWVSGRSGTVTGESLAAMGTDVTRSPFAMSLALVVLACWAVVLVTRGWFRRLVTVLAAVASVGYALVVALEPRNMLDGLSEALTAAHGAEGAASTDPTAWVVVAGVAAVAMIATTVAAVLAVPRWPEMGTRYDAPGRAREVGQVENNLDMWKALDEGHDPTA